ncbi:TetR family transcriptional regulator [Leifsonia sp. AG29]|uniref:TetR family transcriptional regulator n=1 Tax=Leifsonia sp. AG29 TaxID=2598860 RepID=UPI00131E3F5A|nr:TetR family transcriptional regulator [Leifsonia sp. AG29]
MTMTPEFRGAVEGFREETARVRRAVRQPAYVVNALGRDFRVTEEMVQIFLRQVERVLETDASALVVLRHEHGVELLMVTDDNSFSVRLADGTDSADAAVAE